MPARRFVRHENTNARQRGTFIGRAGILTPGKDGFIQRRKEIIPIKDESALLKFVKVLERNMNVPVRNTTARRKGLNVRKGGA